jgi:hypothetical protein
MRGAKLENLGAGDEFVEGSGSGGSSLSGFEGHELDRVLLACSRIVVKGTAVVIYARHSWRAEAAARRRP